MKQQALGWKIGLVLVSCTSTATAHVRTGTYDFCWDVPIPEHKDKGRVVKAVLLTVPFGVSLQLKPDGTYTLKEYKHVSSGRYTIKGSDLYLVLPNKAARAHSVFKGNDILFDKRSWRKAGVTGFGALNERFVKRPAKATRPKATAKPITSPTSKSATP